MLQFAVLILPLAPQVGARTPQKKNTLNAQKIREIFETSVTTHSFALPKNYDFKNSLGNAYDVPIGLWVSFWNSVFEKNTNITPDFVKVLIMSESSFRSHVIAHGHNEKAIGLMQLTEQTIRLLHPNEEELRNYYLELNAEDLKDPIVNIAAGVRWLYHKHKIAKHFLKTTPTDLQLAEEYKGIRNSKTARAEKQRQIFMKLQSESMSPVRL